MPDERAQQILADHLQEALDLPEEEALSVAKAFFRVVDHSRIAAAE